MRLASRVGPGTERVLSLFLAAALAACGSGSAGPSASGDGGSRLEGGGIEGGGTDGGAFDSNAGDGGVGVEGGAADAGCGAPEALIPAWVTAFAPAQEIYIAPTGSDTNPGTKQAPLQTSAAAFAKLAPGVRLNFATGTYACGFIQNFAGSTSAPGAIVSSDGPLAAKFDCGGNSSLYFSMVRGFIVDGIELSNSGTGHGVQLDSGGTFDPAHLSGDFALLHSYIHDTGLANFKIAQSDGVTVVDCKLTSAGKATPGRQNLEFVATDNVILAGNEAFGSTGAFDEVKGGAMHGQIYRNYVHDTAGGILVGGDCTGQQFLVHTTADYEATDLRVWDNVVANENSEAFRIVGCHDCTVENNTFYAPMPQVALRVIADAFASPGSSTCNVPLHNANLTIENNVFAGAIPFTYMITSSETAPVMGLALNHNAWWGGAGDDVTKTGSDIPFTGDPASLYSVDPKLVMPPMDLHPAPASPLLGKGASPPFGPGNFDGKCWPGAPNIGAY